MKKTFRILVLMFALAFASVGFSSAVSPAESQAQLLGRNRVWHSCLSERSYVTVASGYNGAGTRSRVYRCHRPKDGVGTRSVWVPKWCKLMTNGWSFYRAWDDGGWANVGKYPFVHVTLKIDCLAELW